MSGRIDKIKGATKQMVGAVTGNEELQTEGRIERRIGGAKEKVSHLTGRVEKAAHSAKRRAFNVLDGAKSSAHKS